MAEGPRKPPTKPIRMKVSPNLHDYLELLVRETMLGASINDVASVVLSTRLQALKDAGYPQKGSLNPQGPTEQK
jgi:hypothetical protein